MHALWTKSLLFARLDNPIQPTWTLASEPRLRESLPPPHRSQQGSRYVVPHSYLHTSLLARLPTGVLERT